MGFNYCTRVVYTVYLPMSTSNSHSINGNYSCRRRSIDGSFTSSIKSEEAVPLMNSANYSVSSIDSEDDDRLSYISMVHSSPKYFIMDLKLDGVAGAVSLLSL